MKNIPVDMDDFAIGLETLLADVEPGVRMEMMKVVPKAARATARKVKQNARDMGWNGRTGSRYVNGFGSRVTRTGVMTSAEVGNRNVPGLVHLLEKGHNTLGGDRVPGKPHMAPAFDSIKEKYFKDVLQSVDKVLKG